MTNTASPRRNLASYVAEYNALIAAHRYEAAYALFQERLNIPTLYSIGDICLQRIPILEGLFPDGIEHAPPLPNAHDQLKVMHSLGQAYTSLAGLPHRAILVYQQHNALAERVGEESLFGMGLGDIAKPLRQVGRLREAEQAARQGLLLQRKHNHPGREAVNLYRHGLNLALRGESLVAEPFLHRALEISQTHMVEQAEGSITALLAQRALWAGNHGAALAHARRSWEIADKLATNSSHLDLRGVFKIRTTSARIIGDVMTQQNALDEAETWIQTSLSTANLISMVEEQISALRIQAEIARLHGQVDLVHHSVQRAWTMVEAGPYTIYHADLYLTLARLYEQTQETEKAINAAQTAYRMSWCDGPPFAYARGLHEAQTILERLQSALPDLPAYDSSRWPTLPEVKF